MKSFKLELYFQVNNEWENTGYSIRDRVPEKGDTLYEKGKSYEVVDIKEDENDFNVYDVFLTN